MCDNLVMLLGIMNGLRKHVDYSLISKYTKKIDNGLYSEMSDEYFRNGNSEKLNNMFISFLMKNNDKFVDNCKKTSFYKKLLGLKLSKPKEYALLEELVNNNAKSSLVFSDKSDVDINTIDEILKSINQSEGGAKKTKKVLRKSKPKKEDSDSGSSSESEEKKKKITKKKTLTKKKVAPKKRKLASKK